MPSNPDEPRQSTAQRPTDAPDDTSDATPNEEEAIEATFWVGVILITLASGLWVAKFLELGTLDYQFVQLFVVAGLVLIAGKEAIQGAIDALTK